MRDTAQKRQDDVVRQVQIIFWRGEFVQIPMRSGSEPNFSIHFQNVVD